MSKTKGWLMDICEWCLGMCRVGRDEDCPNGFPCLNPECKAQESGKTRSS